MKAGEVAFERFEPITGRYPQIIERRRGVDDIELARSHTQNFRR
jgi:hypothetical protein